MESVALVALIVWLVSWNLRLRASLDRINELKIAVSAWPDGPRLAELAVRDLMAMSQGRVSQLEVPLGLNPDPGSSPGAGS